MQWKCLCHSLTTTQEKAIVSAIAFFDNSFLIIAFGAEGIRKMEQQKYEYHNLPIPGGGYVTGFAFHPQKAGVLYARTDIGGVYRFEEEKQCWKSLIDHVTMDDLSETYPIAIALDEHHPERLYIACGINDRLHGKLAVSQDRGETFRYYEMPMHIHGNLNGRGTGYRLIVDRQSEEKLWFASQDSGLWKSEDYGKSWEPVPGFAEQYTTLVGQTADGKALFVGGAGVTTKRGETLRGHSLQVSYDNGVTFEELWQPQDGKIEGVRLAGLVAQRYALDEKYLYVTYSVMGRNAYVDELGYSCDGGSVIGGKVVRYPLEAGRIGAGEDITPESGLLEYGFSGVDTVAAVPGLLVASTISKEDGDCIFRSRDYGTTWECILYDLQTGELAFRTSYLTPRYNGGHSLIHWMTDLKINPCKPEEVWFNTGTGVFRSKNLTAEKVTFQDWSDGIEETVHLNLYSPPRGEVKCIDIVGDLGGFAFSRLDMPCANSFDDADGNRYITCINADYSDEHPECVVVTPRGNWTGKTKGGLISTKDQCKTFRRLPMPYGISGRIDEALHRIETPNVNSGWVAMTPDCNHIVWSIAENINLPVDMVVASHDGGETFHQVLVYDLEGRQKRTGGFKAFSDRMTSNLFYGFGDHSDFYVSEDGGGTFREVKLPEEFPAVEFTLIDCANKTEVRGECGKQGVFYLAVKEHGLWKLHYDAAKKKAAMKKLSKDGDIIYRLGLGVLHEGGSYYKENKALYVAATIDGEYGFYRSVDDGQSYVRLNTDKQMYGEINSMEGDSQVYGRFYIATGSRGVLYGEPC